MSNQKGGVGKSAFTVLLASYYHYVKNLNVAVIDCDSPQHSLSRMRERDMQAIGRSDYFKQQIASQFERIQKKAYPIINATTDQAREVADQFIREKGQNYDLILFDLPGTMEAAGVFRTILNMDLLLFGFWDRLLPQKTPPIRKAKASSINSAEDVLGRTTVVYLDDPDLAATVRNIVKNWHLPTFSGRGRKILPRRRWKILYLPNLHWRKNFYRKNDLAIF